MSSSTDATTSLVQSEYKYSFYTGHRDGIRTAGKLSWFLLPAARPEKSRRKRSLRKKPESLRFLRLSFSPDELIAAGLGEGEKGE
jgi:hypothetical protein